MNQHVLYRFYDRSDVLLYVGITNNPESRFSDHRREQPWWDKAVNIKLEHFKNRGELAQAEITAIQTEHPKYNKVHAAGLLETIRTATEVTHISEDASRFGNTPPPSAGYYREPRLRATSTCPVCFYPVTCAADEYAKQIGDWECMNCTVPRSWTPEEWEQATLGIVLGVIEP